MEKRGIEGIKAIVVTGLSLGNAIDKSVNSEGMARVIPFLSLTDEVATLMTVDWSSIKEEYLDMDSDEKAELSVVIQKTLDLESDRTEEIIEKSLDLALKLEGIVKESILLAKSMRKDS